MPEEDDGSEQDVFVRAVGSRLRETRKAKGTDAKPARRKGRSTRWRASLLRQTRAKVPDCECFSVTDAGPVAVATRSVRVLEGDRPQYRQKRGDIIGYRLPNDVVLNSK